MICSVVIEPPIDFIKALWEFLKWAPQVALAVAAFTAANAWKKQVREPDRIEIARTAIVTSSKIRDHLATLRKKNWWVLSAIRHSMERLEEDPEDEFANSQLKNRGLLPRAMPSDLTDLDEASVGLAYELDARGFSESANGLRRLHEIIDAYEFCYEFVKQETSFRSEMPGPEIWHEDLVLQWEGPSNLFDAEDDVSRKISGLCDTISSELGPVVSKQRRKNRSKS